MRGAEGGAGAGELRAVLGADDAEVQQLDADLAVVLGEEHVAGLEVAVDEAGAVDRGHAPGDLGAPLADVAPRHGALSTVAQAGLEVLADQQLHRVEDGAAGVLAERVDLDDVAVAQAGDGPRLTEEALDVVAVAGEVLAQHLEGAAAA